MIYVTPTGHAATADQMVAHMLRRLARENAVTLPDALPPRDDDMTPPAAPAVPGRV